MPLTVVRKREDCTAQVMRNAERELKGWGKRYATYRDLGDFERSLGALFDLIDHLEDATD